MSIISKQVKYWLTVPTDRGGELRLLSPHSVRLGDLEQSVHPNRESVRVVGNPDRLLLSFLVLALNSIHHVILELVYNRASEIFSGRGNRGPPGEYPGYSRKEILFK